MSGRGKLLRVDEIQAMLNVSRSKAYELVAQGNFVALRVGKNIRVTQESVDGYITRQILAFSLEDEESVQGVL